MKDFPWLPKWQTWIWGQCKPEWLKLQGRHYREQKRENLPATSHHWVLPNWLKAKATAPLVFYRVHKSMWNSICFAETPAQTCLGIFTHIDRVHVSIQRDKGPPSPSRFAWSQTKLMWYLAGSVRSFTEPCHWTCQLKHFILLLEIIILTLWKPPCILSGLWNKWDCTSKAIRNIKCHGKKVTELEH